MYKIGVLLYLIVTVSMAARGASAPSGPGIMGVWSRPDKQALLGTPTENLWATIADGVLTETYFPTIDRAQTKDTQLLFQIGKTILEERKDFHHTVKRFPQSLAFQVTSTNDAFQIRIEKYLALDPQRSTLLVNYVVFFGQPLIGKIFVLHNPSADNTAGGDAIFVNQNANGGEMLAYQSDRRGDEPPIFSRRSFQYLFVDHVASEMMAGFEGVNDPWTQLHNGDPHRYNSAQNGNVAAALGFDISGPKMNFRVALAFNEEAPNVLAILREKAKLTLAAGDNILNVQQAQWSQYLNTLNPVGRNLEPHVLVLRALEDKIYAGSIVAGPSIPAIPDALEARESDYEMARLRRGDMNAGYHRVWPRDAVQMALGLLAAGDAAAPLRVLRRLGKIQYPNGTFPQNVWVDGQVSWNSFQLDQTAFPIILTARLVELGAASYGEFQSMVVRAADAIVKLGPWTDQERWEENRGLSPNTIALACQALYEAAWMEGPSSPRSAIYTKTADLWKNSIYLWTFVNRGNLGVNYFERMEIAQDFSHMAIMKLNNNPVGGDTFVENEIIDGGFLQWIISGLIPGQDPHFTSSLAVYDRVARAPAFGGTGYLRYNHDGFGPGHLGRAWPLLSGERALASLVRGEDASEHVKVLTNAVTPAGMICEQTSVSDCPLGWAHAEMLIVARSFADHRSFYISQHVRAPFRTATMR